MIAPSDRVSHSVPCWSAVQAEAFKAMPPEILETFRRSLPPGTCDDVDKLQAMLAEGILASGCVPVISLPAMS